MDVTSPPHGSSARSPRRLPLVRLSKSRYTLGLQCHKRLWWTVHEPDAPELVVGPSLQAVFDRGHRVGEAARQVFPGGTLIDVEPWKVLDRVAATRAALAAGARVVFEASFIADEVFVAVDVLHRASGERDWTITEVKSTYSVKDEHVADAAVQAHVARAAGLPVSNIELMHLRREYRQAEPSALFVREDVTARASAALSAAPREIDAQLGMLRASAAPLVEPGAQCGKPWPCPFTGRCGPAV